MPNAGGNSMPISRARRKELNRAAERIRNILDIDNPSELARAVEELGGSVVFDRESQYEATVQKTPDSFVIHLNPDMPPNRRSFSIAHELGHLFVHMGYPSPERWNGVSDYSPLKREGYTDEEIEANEFAAGLLMPETEFRNAYNEDNIDELAEKFGVSRAAAETRAKWLELKPWT
jgi:Zn-dependent peptidase ImmA (M78 family)